MPTYEYKCDECGLRFERWQHITDPPLATCPECGGTVHRLLQPVGIIFKGSGFYSTDNRRTSSSTRDEDHRAERGDATPESKESG